MKLRRKHEQSIIDSFSNYFLKKGRELGRSSHRFSLDGQDSILGADYIFTSNTKFALVEFKYEEGDLKAEGRKPLRETLCLRLDEERRRHVQSLQCHYIAWSTFIDQHRRILFNKYYPEICNTNIFPRTPLLNYVNDQSTRVRAEFVVDQFMIGEIGADYETFNNYTNWLLTLGGREYSGVEIMLDNPASNQLEILEFSSIELVNDFLVHNRPAPTPSSGPSFF